MKRSDRIKDLEENATGIDPEYRELMELYFEFEQALEDGDKKLATRLRERAEPWMQDDEGFTKLAYFPPEGATDVPHWLQFVKYNFGLQKS